MNNVNAVSMASPSWNWTLKPFRPALVSTETAKTVVGTILEGASLNGGEGKGVEAMANAGRGKAVETMMAPAGTASGSSASSTMVPAMTDRAPAMVMASPPSSASRMDGMMAVVPTPEPGPGQRALADEALAFEYNRLVDYHTRYPNFWSSIREPLRECAAEVIGTFIVCMAGIGTNLQVNLSSRSDITPGPRGDYNSISWGWSLGGAAAVWVTGGVSGGHLNPVVTLCFAVFRGFPWRKVPFYIFSQVLGAFLAGLVCYFNYIHAITIFEGSPTTRTVPGTAAFLTCYPLPYVSNVNAFFNEFTGDFLLMLAVFAITDRTNGGGLRRELVPLAIWAILFIISSGFGAQTQWALNPARDFGPRLVTAIAGYGSEVWTFRDGYFFWCNVLGPISGGLCASLVYETFINIGPDSIINRPSRVARDYLREKERVQRKMESIDSRSMV